MRWRSNLLSATNSQQIPRPDPATRLRADRVRVAEQINRGSNCSDEAIEVQSLIMSMRVAIAPPEAIDYIFPSSYRCNNTVDIVLLFSSEKSTSVD